MQTSAGQGTRSLGCARFAKQGRSDPRDEVRAWIRSVQSNKQGKWAKTTRRIGMDGNWWYEYVSHGQHRNHRNHGQYKIEQRSNISLLIAQMADQIRDPLLPTDSRPLTQEEVQPKSDHQWWSVSAAGKQAINTYLIPILWENHRLLSFLNRTRSISMGEWMDQPPVVFDSQSWWLLWTLCSVSLHYQMFLSGSLVLYNKHIFTDLSFPYVGSEKHKIGKITFNREAEICSWEGLLKTAILLDGISYARDRE